MGDTGGKSGRRPARHLQVEASGPANAVSVQPRLARRGRGCEIAPGRTRAAWAKVGAPELSSGPGWKIQEVSRVGAQRVTPKSQRRARQLPREGSRGLRADSGEDWRRKGGCAGPGGKVDAPEASSGPGWEIQEVSRVGAQGVTSKSKLLAREMPRVCSRGLRVDSGEDCRRKGGCAGPGSKVDAPEVPSGPGWEIQEVSRVGAQGVTSKSKLLAREIPRVCSRGLRVDSGAS